MPNFSTPHPKLSSVRPLIWLSILIGIIIFIVNALPVAGASSFNAAQWIVDFDFTEENIDATLTVEVGHLSNSGDFMVLLSKRTGLDCIPVGDLEQHELGLGFHGKGHLSCDFPSIAEIVAHMTDDELILAPTCTCKTPWLNASVLVEPSAPTGVPLPMFYHPDIQFSTEIDPITSTPYMSFQVDHGLVISENYLLNGDFQALGASMKQQSPAAHYSGGFTLDGSTISTWSQNFGKPLEVSTGAAVIYVGYQPLGENFQGMISRLVVDPPCLAGGI